MAVYFQMILFVILANCLQVYVYSKNSFKDIASDLEIHNFGEEGYVSNYN